MENNYSQMSFHKMRSVAKERGLKFSNSITKKELGTLLGSADTVHTHPVSLGAASESASTLMPRPPLTRENDLQGAPTGNLIMDPALVRGQLSQMNISEDRILADTVRSDLNALFKESPCSFSIDTSEMTVHFLGGTLGPICTTLRQPLKQIIYQARKYLAARTVHGHDFMIEHVA